MTRALLCAWFVLLACDPRSRSQVDLEGHAGGAGDETGGNGVDYALPVTNDVPPPASDTTPPTLVLGALPSTVRGGDVYALSYVTSADVVSLGVWLSEDGAPFQAAGEADPSATSLDLVFPMHDVADLRVRLVALDAAGNRAEATTASACTVDATPPSPLAVSAPALTELDVVPLTVTACDDVAFIMVTEGTAPTFGEWLPCATSFAGSLPSEGVHSLQVWFADAMFNAAPTPTSVTIERDSTSPSVVLSSPKAGDVFKPSVPLLITWSAADANLAAITLEYATDGQTFTLIADALPNTGSFDWQSPSIEGETTVVRVTATDALGHSQSDESGYFTVDGAAPVIDRVVIADENLDGDDLDPSENRTGTVLVTVDTYAHDEHPTLFSLRLTEVLHNAPCVYADDGWRTADVAGPTAPSGQRQSFVLTPLDGQKRICVWAKDDAGNVSSAGFDEIDYFVGNIPMVRSFSVLNDKVGDPNFGTRIYAAGDPVKIDWQVTDVEGLTAQPIALDFTTDETTWQPITAAFGPPAGETSYTGTYTGFVAPSSGVFRVRIRATDQNGNTSITVTSDVMNAPGWSIYLGTSNIGEGGGGLAAELQSRWTMPVAIDPSTNDIYATNYGVGLMKLDAHTGLVSRFIRQGAINLPDDGPLPENPSAPVSNVFFDGNGRLLMQMEPNGYWSTNSTIVYQLELASGYVKRLLGSYTATENEAGSAPFGAFAFVGGMAVDEDQALYYYTTCASPPSAFQMLGYQAGPPTPLRIMRGNRAADGSISSIEVIAGRCDTAAANPPDGPVGATDVAIGAMQYAPISGLQAFHDGPHLVIYYGGYYNNMVRKIIDGQIYATAIPQPDSGVILRHPVSHNLLITSSGSLSGIHEYTTNTAGNGGEVYVGPWVSGGGSGDCMRDGVDATAACVTAQMGLTATSDGTVFFIDGPGINSARAYRVRYRDADLPPKVRTIVGTLPFFTDAVNGLPRNVVRGSFAGIAWKDVSTTGFPRGLYFSEFNGPVFARVEDDSATPDTPGLVQVVWGNQQGNYATLMNGQSVGPTASMSVPYVAGNGMPIAFHPSTGRPWLRADSKVVQIDEDHNLVLMQSGSSFWEDAASGSDPRTSSLYVFGGIQNFSLKGDGLFLIGGYPLLNHPVFSRLSFFDFGGNSVQLIQGGMADGSAPDSPAMSPPALDTQPLPNGCLNAGSCYLDYRAADDRLYFMEQVRNPTSGLYTSSLRYISEPTTPANARLHTASSWTTGAAAQNFVFDPRDNNRLFYVRSGQLYCRRLSGAADWCDDTALGPPITAITPAPNQLAFDDATAPETLFVSSGGRFVFRYTLPD